MTFKKFFILSLLTVIFAGSSMAQTAEELLELGREAFLNYDFSEAASQYAQAKKKIKDPDDSFNDKYNRYENELRQAKNFIGRVEKIIIIDSITVPKKEFFSAYKIPGSSGHLSGKRALPFHRDGAEDYVFTNEREDYKLWAEPDTTGHLHLMESTLLTDGKWSEPSPLDDELSEDSDAAYPFMMADGVTLYYAEKGDNSMGGYDIMIANRDAADGKFMQPSNLGFPYNSPFDDYLLVIDELNGVGWWATDRKQLEDELTLYVFIVNDLRENYPDDEENIVSFARIDDFIETQPEDANYDELLATIRAIKPATKEIKPEFTLRASGGRVYHFYNELPNVESKSTVRKYLSSLAELEKQEIRLTELRKQYHKNRSSSVASQIKDKEIALEKQRQTTQSLLSEVYKSLK